MRNSSSGGSGSGRTERHRATSASLLGFGQGTHACIGLHVARLEADIALRELVARIPGYGIRKDSLERYQTEFVQGFSKLQVVCRGG